MFTHLFIHNNAIDLLKPYSDIEPTLYVRCELRADSRECNRRKCIERWMCFPMVERRYAIVITPYYDDYKKKCRYVCCVLYQL